MKTLITTLAVLTLSFSTLPAKEGTFTSVIIADGGAPLQLTLSSRQWIKITNFVQNDTDMTGAKPADRAGIAVFKGGTGLWVLFATKTNFPEPHADVIVAGPATILVSPPATDATKDGATVFLTYQRGSD